MAGKKKGLKGLKKLTNRRGPVPTKVGRVSEDWVVETGRRILREDRKTFEALD